MNTVPQKRILIVEDEHKLAEVLIEYFAQAGYLNHWLADGVSVAAWVKDNNPELILLDLMLPGRDGMDVCRSV